MHGEGKRQLYPLQKDSVRSHNPDALLVEGKNRPVDEAESAMQ